METPEEMVESIAAGKAGKKPRKATKPKTGKHAGGRPTKYAPEMCEAVEATAMQGATTLSIAAACGVSIQTVYTWCDEHPEFLEAVTRAKHSADDLIENALFRRAKGTQLTPPDTKACTVWLGNRRPDKWRETARVEVTGANGGPIAHADATKDTLEAYAAEALALATIAGAVPSGDADSETEADGTR